MTATLTNGRPHQQRKQLSDQLDRLDVLIDCLSEALPQAVADATRDGTRQAVRDVLAELFGNPETLARLRAALAAQAPVPAPVSATPESVPARVPVASEPGFLARAKATALGRASAVAAKVKRAFAAVKLRAQAAKARVAEAIRRTQNVVPLGRFVAIATAVGVIVAVVSYTVPQGFSAVISGVGGAVVAAGVQVYSWLRRSARTFGLLA